MKIFKTINFLGFACLLFSCSGSNRELRKKLQEVIINKSNVAITNGEKYSLLRLSDITDFDWDKFYIFEEYVSKKNITEITGIEWDGTDVPSGTRRMLFVYNNKITQYVDFDPSECPVFGFPCGKMEQFEFTKREDLFAVFKRSDKNGYRYAMVPERCIKTFFENMQ